MELRTVVSHQPFLYTPMFHKSSFAKQGRPPAEKRAPFLALPPEIMRYTSRFVLLGRPS